MSHSDFAREFGEKLRSARADRAMTQESLAAAAGLHRTHISLIERGQRSIRLETIEQLARALSCEPGALMPSRLDPSRGRALPEGCHADLARLNALFPAVRDYQRLATSHGIADIFQDNGGKLLQALLVLNLKCAGSRLGNDAVDQHGNEYELKTVNVDLVRSFTTHHHLNLTILDKYRKVDWFFSIYRGIELVEIYRMSPATLEARFFGPWERKWHDLGGRDLNNPKIPVGFVRQHGKLIYRDPADERI